MLFLSLSGSRFLTVSFGFNWSLLQTLLGCVCTCVFVCMCVLCVCVCVLSVCVFCVSPLVSYPSQQFVCAYSQQYCVVSSATVCLCVSCFRFNCSCRVCHPRFAFAARVTGLEHLERHQHEVHVPWSERFQRRPLGVCFVCSAVSCFVSRMCGVCAIMSTIWCVSPIRRPTHLLPSTSSSRPSFSFSRKVIILNKSYARSSRVVRKRRYV